MIEINVPGWKILRIDHLVCDVNGTLALDSILLNDVAFHQNLLRDRLSLHLLTADTYHKQEQIDHQLHLKAICLREGNEVENKRKYVRKLGSQNVAAIGQGANDSAMLKEAGLGICVLGREGTSPDTLQYADLVVPDVISAFEVLEKPLRLIASLRR